MLASGSFTPVTYIILYFALLVKSRLVTDSRYLESFSYEWESYRTITAPRLAVLKEFDWMRCICTLFDWFKKEAIWVSRYRRFPTHTKTTVLNRSWAIQVSRRADTFRLENNILHSVFLVMYNVQHSQLACVPPCCSISTNCKTSAPPSCVWI